MVGLKRGAKSLEVKKLQESLNFHMRSFPPQGKQRLHPRLVPDGAFGPLTEACLKAFQNLNSLNPSGVVDANTKGFLYNFRRTTMIFSISREVEKPTPVANAFAARKMPNAFAAPVGFARAAFSGLPPMQVVVPEPPRTFTVGSEVSVELPEKEKVHGAWKSMVLTLTTTSLLRSHPDVKLVGGIELSVGGKGSDPKYSVSASGEFSQEKLVTVGDLSFGMFQKAELESENGQRPTLKFGMGPKLTYDIVKDKLSVEVGFSPAVGWDFQEGKVKAEAALPLGFTAVVGHF